MGQVAEPGGRTSITIISISITMIVSMFISITITMIISVINYCDYCYYD